MTSDRKIKVSFTLNEKSEPTDVKEYERTEAHQIVEEVSSVAGVLEERTIS
jgi:protein SSD1